MWKRVLWVFGGVLSLAVAAFALQLIASESGEVVVLETQDGDGVAHTRLWVVEEEGQLWLRSGGEASRWYQRLVAEPQITLERQGLRRGYLAHPEPDRVHRINDLMAAKYGWRDTVVGWFVGDRSADVPVRLEPSPEG